MTPTPSPDGRDDDADRLLEQRAAAVTSRDLSAFTDVGLGGDPYAELVLAGTRRQIAGALEDDAMRDIERALTRIPDTAEVTRLARLAGVSRPTIYAARLAAEG